MITTRLPRLRPRKPWRPIPRLRRRALGSHVNSKLLDDDAVRCARFASQDWEFSVWRTAPGTTDQRSGQASVVRISIVCSARDTSDPLAVLRCTAVGSPQNDGSPEAIYHSTRRDHPEVADAVASLLGWETETDIRSNTSSLLVVQRISTDIADMTIHKGLLGTLATIVGSEALGAPTARHVIVSQSPPDQLIAEELRPEFEQLCDALHINPDRITPWMPS